MENCTVNKIKDSNLVLQNHIEYIIGMCKQVLPQCSAIVLYGSYGRGEGGWYSDEYGVLRPYNDYDIKIISEKIPPSQSLKVIANEIADKIGIRWIDLGVLTPEQLERKKMTVLNYEFKYASKVIFGNQATLESIPCINAAHLSTIEIQTLFFTRLYTLIGSLNERGLNQLLKGEDSRFFRNQMAKAVLAAVDVVLLMNHEYHWSYCKRVELVSDILLENKEYVALCRWALNEKLHPESPDMSVEEVTLLYQKVNALYFTEMFKGLSVHFKMKINSPEMIELCMKWLPTQLVRRLYRIIRFRNLSGERELNILLAQMYIAAAWSKEGIDRKRLDRGCRLMKFESWEKNSEDMVVWNSARLYVAKIRMEL